jgi:hypothetical protein
MNNLTDHFRSHLALPAAIAGMVLIISGLAQAWERPWGDGSAGSQEPVPNRERFPNQGRNPGTPPRDRPGIQSNQALVTLTLEPATIYQGDRVTLRWEVKDRRPNVAWASPVRIRCSFRLAEALPSSVPTSGSYSFVAGASPHHGTFTLSTGSALFYSEKAVEYNVALPPSITRLTVETSTGRFTVAGRGTTGDRVGIIGTNFGERRGGGEVNLTINNRTAALPVQSWSDERIIVRVPTNAPAGSGAIQVSVGGGRLVSNGLPFTVVKSITITNAMLQAVVAAIGLGQTQIHLDRGNNASSITFSDSMNAVGVSDRNFTVPNLERNVPRGARIAASIVLPFGGFPERIKYYVNNVNSNNVVLSISDGQLVLRIGFESSRAEIKGELKYCNAGLFGQCITSSWMDGGAPDVQVNNAMVVIRFTPAVSRGSLSFSSASAAFDANFQIGGDFEDWLITSLNNYRDQVRPTINTALNGAVNRVAVRNAVANALMNQLRQLGLNRVQSVSAVGGNITITFE